MATANAPLNSCAETRPELRIRQPNSSPRRIAVHGLGARGQALAMAAAEAAGIALMPFPADDAVAEAAASGERPDLIVVVGPADADAGTLPAIDARARALGVLVTAVVVSEGEHPADGPALDAMRRNADMIVQTTDDEFLAIMLQWLGRPA